ncbi:hypothetical protein NUW58_g6691 [Xylaria curta]|uniref:Uncharacterized protein n=1 Tax=Xylaria curta TaxID=42375 RepID=A0ACC1NR83_9PEZI|nr:hypothetical protein NUW58_g6691 [Xylaria curta]
MPSSSTAPRIVLRSRLALPSFVDQFALEDIDSDTRLNKILQFFRDRLQLLLNGLGALERRLKTYDALGPLYRCPLDADCAARRAAFAPWLLAADSRADADPTGADLNSSAMMAAVEAEDEAVGRRGSGDLLLAQPNDAAALAAEPFASRPMEGKLGRSSGFA